ncbi:MAG: DUF1385 domain-containing protein [Clostridiales bacterium]|nr:DUF1385 domain-containing protein [Clostridiales bacterium]
MKYSGIGGQAVMEGVMMKNKDRYAVAVRKPDNEIEVQVTDYKASSKLEKFSKIPIVRGIVNFIESLYLGMSTLMFSASFFEDEEETKERERKMESLSEDERKKQEEREKKQENAMMGGTVVVSLVAALVIFFAIPYVLSSFMERFVPSQILVALIEGLIRLAIFVAYIALISLMPDIRRVYMYHGAEHKCINCIEHGLELTVDNVRISSRQHKRCGTSFLLIVVLLSIVFFLFIQVDSRILRILLRLVLIPIIAGVAYEFIRLAGRYDNWLVNILSKPGLWMQGLTTREPDDGMIEVGIASVEAVFDWRKWQEEEL